MDYEENKKSFLEELRSLEEGTKRKVVMVATAVVMIGVVYLWLGYFNGFASSLTQGAPDGQVAQSSGDPGLSANIKNGMATIGNSAVGAAKWIAGLFTNPGQYTIHSATH